MAERKALNLVVVGSTPTSGESILFPRSPPLLYNLRLFSVFPPIFCHSRDFACDEATLPRFGICRPPTGGRVLPRCAGADLHVGSSQECRRLGANEICQCSACKPLHATPSCVSTNRLCCWEAPLLARWPGNIRAHSASKALGQSSPDGRALALNWRCRQKKWCKKQM